MLPPDDFEDLPNTFLDAIFKNRPSDDHTLPPQASIRTLSSISNLYLYVNPPPMAYGTPAPKVVETVTRSWSFNKKRVDRERVIGNYIVDHPAWDNKDPFPFNEITSNFHPGIVHQTSIAFLRANWSSIREISEKVIEKYLATNSDVLTKGRQTWCPLTESSIPSAQAYMNMCDFLVANGKPNHHSLLEFLLHLISLIEATEIKGKKAVYKYENTKVRSGGQIMTKRKLKRYIVDHTYKGEECKKYMLDLFRSFCSYLKHGERAHLKRRAIASPSIPNRCLLLIAEELHLKLGKVVTGSTISIGGEEKKMKIIETMDKPTDLPHPYITKQATQDATKWNECLSASAFGMMSKTFFDNGVREKYNIAECSEAELLMGKICNVSHFICAIKRITLGPGPVARSQFYHGNLSYKEENRNKYSDEGSTWFGEALDLLEDDIYIRAGGGMLMGMYNALSTTYGLLAIPPMIPNKYQVFTLRSSDDSMTKYVATDLNNMCEAIDAENLSLKLHGINLSMKKTHIFEAGFGEYNSWYMDGKMVSQYGAESTVLRPGGQNPPTDFYTIARSVSNGLIKAETNLFGAEAQLRIGINNVRSLYRIKKREVETGGVRNVVRVLSDGGTNPWNVTNSHLEETCLKESLVELNPVEIDYLLRIRNPKNPFIGEPKEDITWDKDAGTLTTDFIETPRTLFHSEKRANRSIVNKKGENNQASERIHTEALNLITMCDPSTLLKVPNAANSMASHMLGQLRLLAGGCNLEAHEQIEFDEAINRLLGLEPEVSSDEEVLLSD